MGAGNENQKEETSSHLIGKGFVKTEGFEKSVVFFMSLMGQIWEASQRHKSFRLELDYDAEALNTRYRFYSGSEMEDGGNEKAASDSRAHRLRECLNLARKYCIPLETAIEHYDTLSEQDKAERLQGG